jgi:hypothetical protein
LPETEVEQNDHSVSALVEDSDGEEEYKLPPPAPVVAPAPAPVAESVVEPVADEAPKKKAVARKVKKDA